MTPNEKPGAGTPGRDGIEASYDTDLRIHSMPAGNTRQAPAHGYIRNGVWVKKVVISKHLRIKPFCGWACDVSDLELAEAAGARGLLLEESEEGQTYWAELDVIRRKGKTFDYGFGPQICLALGYWHIDHKGDVASSRQLPLFGGLR